MKIKNYPYRSHLRRVLNKHVTTRDVNSFLKEKGILVHAFRKEDLSRIGADYYYSMANIVDLKEKIDSPTNYKKTSRINIPTNQVDELKSTLTSLTGQKLDNDEDTRVTVLSNPDGTWMFEIDYTEYKPSLINLLDVTNRKITVNVNEQGESTSLDFSLLTPHDYKKVTEVIKQVHKNSDDFSFNFSEISLSNLTKKKRISLFDNFFNYKHESWSLVEITKLKVKRDKNDEEETDISKDQLAGINSALLDGKNLIENNFVKSTLKNGFYFSMATMKFENQSTPEFIELVIDFKSRPERCETNIVSSGFYEEDGLGIRTIKNLFDTETQNNITFNFKNTLYQIYVELLNSEDVPEEPEINISAEEIELLNEEIQSNKNEAAIAVNNNVHLESNKKEQ
ncbi:hypothetical protein [Niallia circulans]|uniref:hypothetical protein n=1 Tax=Niallia circulans TaxID=1397 RepID=UPI001560085F|nr:hypothetical protein [Niallia circulans]NRG35141.1 hypothetical protein [Niallia circulans]